MEIWCIMKWKMWIVWNVSKTLDKSRFVKMPFGMLGELCFIGGYFWCVYRIRCHFLYIWKMFKDMFYILWNMPLKCEQFAYELLCLFGLFVIWGPKLSPPPIPIPGVNVKVPFGGKIIVFKWFVAIWNNIYEHTGLSRTEEGVRKCSCFPDDDQ